MNFTLSFGFVYLVWGKNKGQKFDRKVSYILHIKLGLLLYSTQVVTPFLFAILYLYTSAQFSVNTTFNSDINKHARTHTHTDTSIEMLLQKKQKAQAHKVIRHPAKERQLSHVLITSATATELTSQIVAFHVTHDTLPLKRWLFWGLLGVWGKNVRSIKITS